MTSQDKALKFLVEAGDPAARRTPAEQFEHALRTVLALTDADAAVALPPAAKRGERLVLYSGSPALATLPTPAHGSELARALGADPAPRSYDDLSAAKDLDADACPGVEAGPALFVAVRHRGPAPGYLGVYRRRGRARFNAADTRALLLLAAALASALELMRLSGGVEKMTLSDDGTAVYNARFLKTALRRELRRAARFGQELSLLLVGVDGYESWCERNGAAQSVALVQEVAAVLGQQVRSFDLLARHQTDRFVLVLPQTGATGAQEVADRVREAIGSHAFASSPAGEITASVGIASFPRQGNDPAALLKAAERALASQSGQDKDRAA
jgi:diguanylate cyclase (GGDEF)-like protein